MHDESTTFTQAPVAIDSRQMADLRVQPLDRLLRAEFVQEAQAETLRDDHTNDQRLSPIPDDRRNDRRRHQQQQQIAAQLAHEHRHRADAVRAKHIRPVDNEPPGGLDTGKTSPVRAQPAERLRWRKRVSRRQLELKGAGRRRCQAAQPVRLQPARRSLVYHSDQPVQAYVGRYASHTCTCVSFSNASASGADRRPGR
jgi:hypothetical protein